MTSPVRPAFTVVLLHAAVLLAHEVAHRGLGVELRAWQLAFAYLVIVAGPFVALALIGPRPHAGYLTLALTMGAALLFTVYQHYVGFSPDHVSHLPDGDQQGLFRWTSAALAILEAAGVWVGWAGVVATKAARDADRGAPA